MNKVEAFEKLIAEYYGAPYAVAVDCCTHAIELCLRLETKFDLHRIPKHTYVSIPMTCLHSNTVWAWSDEQWEDYYYIGNTNVIDAAVYWQKDGYIPGTKMCLSFQHKKHLSLGRGGMILLDNYDAYFVLKKLRYDGRDGDLPWAEQNIDTYGYHYYMTPETAQEGINKFGMAASTEPRKWSWKDYPDLSKMKVFNA